MTAEQVSGPTDQQVAVTEFGRFALESRSIERSVERAVDVVARVLDAPMVALLEELGPGRVAVVHGTGPVGLTEDVWRPDDVEIAPPGLSAAVPVDGRPWGRLVVADDGSHRFGPGDLAFVETMADVLAAALERERVEGRRASVAALGRFGLASRDIALTIERVVDVVTRTIEAPMGCVLRRGADPGRMTMVQAWGPIGVAPGQDVEVDAAPAVARGCDEPLVTEGRASDRFPARHPGPSLQAAAGVSVPVLVESRDWGRLVVADTLPRRFTPTEVDVLSSAAEVLAAALERERVEQARAAVAAFSRFALSSRDIDATVGRAVATVVEVLEAPAALVRPAADEARFVIVHGLGEIVHGLGEPGLTPGREWAEAAGARASLWVPVTPGGRPWGQLAAFFAEPRPFSPTEVDVVRSVAQVLADALERDRIEALLRRVADHSITERSDGAVDR